MPKDMLVDFSADRTFRVSVEESERLDRFCQEHSRTPEQVINASLNLFMDMFDTDEIRFAKARVTPRADFPKWSRIVFVVVVLLLLSILALKIGPDIWVWAQRRFEVKPF